MKNKPLVSIIIPCYNHEAFLDDCLKSVIAQDYDNIELLICDDASPDGSFQKIKAYETTLNARFARVVILRNQENRGVTANINRMLDIADGEYIKIIASDDALSTDAISSMETFLEENLNYSVVVSNGVKITEDSHYPDFKVVGEIYNAPPCFEKEGFFERVAICNEISAPAAMIRRKLYDEYGLYDESVKVEDFEFWLRVLKQKEVSFAFLNQKLVYYRINQNSMSSMVANSNLAQRRRLMHYSEVGSLNKYSDFFKKNIFYDIVLRRMVAEYGFAVTNDLTDYQKELSKEISRFFCSNKLPFKMVVKYRFIYLKQILRKHIKKTIDQ